MGFRQDCNEPLEVWGVVADVVVNKYLKIRAFEQPIYLAIEVFCLLKSHLPGAGTFDEGYYGNWAMLLM